MMRWILAGALALFAFTVPAIALSPAQINGCQYLLSPPVLTDKQTSPILCDSSGNLSISFGGAITGTVTIDQTTPGVTNGVSITGASGGITDGADITQGAKADAAWTTGSGSTIAIGKAIDRDILASTVALGQTTKAASVPVTMASDQGPLATTSGVSTSGGITTTCVIEPTASDNHQNCGSNAAHNVYWWSAFNNSATINYVRFYDAASFNGCNSATNLKWEGMIPGNSINGGGFIQAFVPPLSFSNGIGVCVTSGYGQTSTSSATASAISITIGYN